MYINFRIYITILLSLIILSCNKDDSSSEPAAFPIIDFTIPGDPVSIYNDAILVNELLEISVNTNNDENIEKIDFFLDQTKIGEDLVSPYGISIDLSSFEPKQYEFIVSATSKSGKVISSKKDIYLDKERLLLIVNYPNSGYFGDLIVFLSKSDGSIIQTKQLTDTPSSLIFHSPIKINATDKFMATFCNISNDGQINSFHTIADLTTENLKEINISTPKYGTPLQQVNYTLAGFNTTTTVRGVGLDHSGVTSDGLQFISTSSIPGEDIGTDKIYFFGYDQLSKEYSYEILNKPLQNEYELNQSNFVTENVLLRTMEFTNSDQPIFLRLHGYESNTALETNSYHQIFFGNLGNSADPINYSFLNAFSEYRSQVSLNDYIIEHIGIPRPSYSIPEWSIDDYSFSQNELSITTSGTDHNVGKLRLTNQLNNTIQYTWDIVFDSKNTNLLIIPELPNELSGFDIYNFSKNNEFEFRQVQISSYKGLSSYEEYLLNIVKNNKRHFYSYDEMESIYKVVNNNSALYIDYDFVYGNN